MQAPHRPLYTIAKEIRADWHNVSPHARPYLQAMSELDRITDRYFEDSAKSVVLYFLSNAASWHGPVARAIKLELKKISKQA